MKKIFKTTVRFLTNVALICIMMAGAQHAMNLSVGWVGVGYLMMFIIGLILWTAYNSKYDKFYKEGYNDGWEAQKINGEIYKEINAGEKNEFEIEMPSFAMHEYVILVGRNNKFVSTDNKNKYMITCIEVLDEGGKVTFAKIKDNEGE